MELSSSFLVVSPSVIPTKSSSSVFCTHASTGVKRLSASTLKCDVAFRPRAPHVDTRHSIYSISIRRYSPISTRAHSPSDRERFVPSVTEVKSFSVSLWKFLRPHTVRGTVLGSVALIARALYENPDSITWAVLLKAFLGIVALLCGNGYIVGINQIYDVGIDKVNKPYLPVAAGDLSQNSAWLLVFFFAFSGFLLVRLNYGPFITSLYFLGLLLGTLYSVPPFRMKRFPVAAFLIIATVRGFLLNYGVYYATRDVLALDFQWNPSVAFITIFVTLFALVIAITKDLPDVDGDRKFKIPTLASKLGVRNVAFLGTGLLMLNYVGAVSAAVCIPLAFHGCLMIAAHALLASGLIFQAWKLERAHYTKEAISKFYQFLWNLFYAEYILFPFI